jgi:hypothetical protein
MPHAHPCAVALLACAQAKTAAELRKELHNKVIMQIYSKKLQRVQAAAFPPPLGCGTRTRAAHAGGCLSHGLLDQI